jgi:hypothetical protein
MNFKLLQMYEAMSMGHDAEVRWCEGSEPRGGRAVRMLGWRIILGIHDSQAQI